MDVINADDRDDLNRSQAAQRIIEDPLVIEALATMERDIYELWSDAGLDAEAREELYRTQMTLRRFVTLFDMYLQCGAKARYILGIEPEQKTFYQRIKEFFHGKTA